MANKSLRQKWIEKISALSSGREAVCPHCQSSNLKEGYIVSSVNSAYGWGGIWCEDCRRGIVLSRVNMNVEGMRDKIMTELPSDLKLI